MGDILGSLWLKHIAPVARSLWESTVFWRSLTLLIFTVLFLAYVFREQLRSLLLRAARREHDKEIFDRSNEIMDEDFLTEYLYLLETDIPWDRAYTQKMRDFYYFFALESNKYLSPRLRNACNKLCDALKDLDDFLVLNTFPVYNRPEAQQVPVEWKSGTEEERKRWNQTQSEITERTKKVGDTYKYYRSAVKSILVV